MTPSHDKKLSSKKKMVVSSANKSVKFQKAITPSSGKKKFAKTPHSLKTPKVFSPENGMGNTPSPNLEKKKRKLSFGTGGDQPLAYNIGSPLKSNKKGTPAKKTPIKIEVDNDDSDSDDDFSSSPQKISNKKVTPAKKTPIKIEVDNDVSDSDDDFSSSPKKIKTNTPTTKKTKGNIPILTPTIKFEESDSDDSDVDIPPKNFKTESAAKKKGKGNIPISTASVNLEESDDSDSESDESDDDSVDSDVDDSELESSLPTPPVAPLQKAKKQKKIESESQDDTPKFSDEEKKKHKKDRTIFVGNLPVSTSKIEVINLFKRYGKVETARLRCADLTLKAKNKKAGVNLKQFEEGSTIAAFVKFKDLESAKAATAFNGQIYKNHHIRVDSANISKQAEVDGNKAVFVVNIPFAATDDQLWEKFESCGKVVSVRIIKHKNNYKSRGKAFVNFASPESVELALKLSGSQMLDRTILVHRWAKVENTNSKSVSKKRKIDNKKGGSPAKQAKTGTEKKKKASPVNSNFSGTQSVPKKQKKVKKQGQEMKKKKKIADILAKA